MTTINICLGFLKLVPSIYWFPLVWFALLGVVGGAAVAYRDHLTKAQTAGFHPKNFQKYLSDHIRNMDNVESAQSQPLMLERTSAGGGTQNHQHGHGVSHSDSHWKPLKDSLGKDRQPDKLPEITMHEVRERSKAGEKLTVIAGLIVDVAGWIEAHPGGTYSIETFVGRDATAAFLGSVGAHPSLPKATHSSYA